MVSRAYNFTIQYNISATSSKFGLRKFSIYMGNKDNSNQKVTRFGHTKTTNTDINLGYPSDLMISVKSVSN